MHPLINLFSQYVKDFQKLKSDNIDMDNRSFNSIHGLFIQPPKGWPLDDAIEEALVEGEFNRIVVIYPSTKVYQEMHKVLERDHDEVPFSIEYFPWHEIYVAMNRVSEDARYIQKLNKMLSEADLVLFTGSGGVPPHVVDQITESCNGCFIRIGRQA